VDKRFYFTRLAKNWSSTVYEERDRADGHGIFVVIALSILAGVLGGVRIFSDLFLAVLCLGLAGSLAAAARIRQKKLIAVSALLLLGLGLGMLRVALVPDHRNELDAYLGRKSEFLATIIREPDERDERTRLVLRPDGGSALITAAIQRWPRIERGDQVLVKGKLVRPANRNATATPEFDYVAYLAKEGIYYEMFLPQVELVNRPEHGLVAFTNKFKARLLAIFSGLLPEPSSGLLAGIVLGARGGISRELAAKFADAGVSHILVLSGFNITLIADWLVSFFAFAPRLLGGLLGSLFIIFFGFLAGGGAVVWRSVIMALVSWYAGLSGRIFDVSAALLATALAVTLWNPKTLTDDLGFQLSLTALAGIVYLAPVLNEKLFWRWPKFLAALFSSTFGAQLAVLPVIWLSMGKLSLVGFVSNLFIVPLVPVTMTLGFLILGAGLTLPFFGWPLAFLAEILLRMIVWLVEFFSAWPLSGVQVTAVPLIALIYSGALTLLTVRYWRRRALHSGLYPP
jgi:competence protein ComEC